MTDLIGPNFYTILAVIISAASLWYAISKERRQQQKYIQDKVENRLDTLDTRLQGVSTDVAKIVGRFEGQRDQQMSNIERALTEAMKGPERPR